VAGIAEGGLDDEVGAELSLGCDHILPFLDEYQPVRHGRHAGPVADAHGFHLVVDAVAQPGGREGDLEAQFIAERLGFLIEHQEDRLAEVAAALGPGAPTHKVDDLFVLEHVVVDVLDALELLVRDFIRYKCVWMAAVEAVDVIDELKSAHPLIEAEQVKAGRADEVGGDLVAVKITSDVRQTVEFFLLHILFY